jgi:hypothetical protein
LQAKIQKASSIAKNPLVKDGGHVILHCSACGEGLVDLWITKPAAAVESVFVALCCYCGDKSFAETVKGGVHVGGYAKEDSPEVPVTKYKNLEIKEGVVYVETEKA